MRPPRPSTEPAPDKPIVVTISRFKVKVADYLRQIERTGGTLIITNRGRQVATVTSAIRRPGNTFVGAGRGAIRVQPGNTPFTALPSWSAAITPIPSLNIPEATLSIEESSDAEVQSGPRLLTNGDD